MIKIKKITKHLKNSTLEVFVEVGIRAKAAEPKEYFTTADLLTLLRKEYNIIKTLYTQHSKLSNSVSPSSYNSGIWKFQLETKKITVPKPSPAVEKTRKKTTTRRKSTRKAKPSVRSRMAKIATEIPNKK